MRITNLIKKSFISSLLIASLVFVSCGPLPGDPNESPENGNNSSTQNPGVGNNPSEQDPSNGENPPVVDPVTDIHSEFNILHVNDTHGYIETSANSNLALIAAYMDTYEVAQSLRVSNGDMFQGTGLSNLTKGRVILDAMNIMNFDCMVVGNHEFDWGIETILSYFDGDESNGEANFPLLASNIVDKNGNPIKYAKPYMIKEINGARVGVIGIIGDTLESSISVKSLAGHEFTDARTAAEKYVKILREDEGCNMVIIATHCGPEHNEVYEGLDVDLILNSHTHLVQTYYSGYYVYENNVKVQKSTIPCIQSGANAKAVGDVDTTIDYDGEENSVKLSMKNWCIKDFGYNWSKNVIPSEITPKAEIENLVTEYNESLSPVLNNPICTVKNGARKNIARFTTAYMKDVFDVDAAFVNDGGFRTDWEDDSVVTYSKLLEMIPFENEMKLCKFTGAGLKVLADGVLSGKKDIVSNSTFTTEDGNYYLDGVLIEDSKEYNLAILDFVFDKSTYSSIFKNAYDVQLTNATLRDLLQECLLLKQDACGVVEFPIYQ